MSLQDETSTILSSWRCIAGERCVENVKLKELIYSMNEKSDESEQRVVVEVNLKNDLRHEIAAAEIQVERLSRELITERESKAKILKAIGGC